MSQMRDLPKKKRLDAPGALRHEMGLRLGVWYWRDETKSLEFRSFTPASLEPKEKGRRGKAVHFAEIDTSDRLTDKRLASREAKSPHALEKRGQKGNVTLSDVKFVALLLLQESEMQRLCSFSAFMRNKNLDHFLMALLYYLSHYLEKSSLEKKPKSYMVSAFQSGASRDHKVLLWEQAKGLKPTVSSEWLRSLIIPKKKLIGLWWRVSLYVEFSCNSCLVAEVCYADLDHWIACLPQFCPLGLVEKKEMELVLSKLEAAQKYLAQKYCVLVLGLGMPDKHHMCCGKEKISNTQKDWKFFESFFTFCAYVAWIVFRRQHFQEIEEEIGRLFRTNMFNIPRRKREDEESGGEKKRMTFVEFRRMMAKRPAIKTAIHMRSPVMSTLLPSLREKAQNVFERKNQVGARSPAQMKKHMEDLESVFMPIVGILGQPRCLFNPHTLLPLEPEENMKSPRRQSFLIEKNNVRIRDSLDLVTKTLSSTTTFSK